MDIKPTELAANGFVQLDILDHKELIPFVQQNLKKRTVYSLLYIVLNVLGLAAIIALFVIHGRTHTVSVGDGFNYLSYGIALTFALIPLHEYIHVLAYKALGASSTAYDVNWKKFYFMAVADQFVVNRKEFAVVALAPFVVISTCVLAALFVTSPAWQFTLWGIYFTHTACCSGDFGLLSYFAAQPYREVVSYDDSVNKMTYFFGKE
jgi:Putative zincin peptidase